MQPWHALVEQSLAQVGGHLDPERPHRPVQLPGGLGPRQIADDGVDDGAVRREDLAGDGGPKFRVLSFDPPLMGL